MLWAPSAASQQGAKGARLSELSTRRFLAHDVGELAFLASSQRTPYATFLLPRLNQGISGEVVRMYWR